MKDYMMQKHFLTQDARVKLRYQNLVQLQESYCRLQKLTSKQVELKYSFSILTAANKFTIKVFLVNYVHLE